MHDTESFRFGQNPVLLLYSSIVSYRDRGVSFVYSFRFSCFPKCRRKRQQQFGYSSSKNNNNRRYFTLFFAAVQTCAEHHSKPKLNRNIPSRSFSLKFICCCCFFFQTNSTIIQVKAACDGDNMRIVAELNTNTKTLMPAQTHTHTHTSQEGE